MTFGKGALDDETVCFRMMSLTFDTWVNGSEPIIKPQNIL